MPHKPFIRYAIWAATLLLSSPAMAQTTPSFTPAERQQISIATPGLFDKSPSFSVNFSQLKPEEYCFPLPVGKAEKKGAYAMLVKTQPGDAVKSMFNGTVRLSRHLPGYGRAIVVRHRNGLETVYYDLKGATVKVGQNVKAGQTIGIVGDNGECSVEMMVNGCIINIETILSLRSHKLNAKTLLFTDAGNSVRIRAIVGNKIIEADQLPDINIELGNAFTDYERRVVSAPTKGLFDDRNSITIDLRKYTDAQWSFPLPGAKVISPYGGSRRHSGIDLKTRANDNILSVFDGVVRFAGKYYGYGNVIVIRHANGLETLYSHNSKNLVKAGDNVHHGQVIALTGRTGRATTEHCHFEVRINGRTYNPSIFFDFSKRTLQPISLVINKSGSIKRE